jgi:hypothetical protein
MAHRAAYRTNPPEVDMRRPKTKQVRADDNTPCAVSVIGGIAGMQLNEERFSLGGAAHEPLRRAP